MLVSFAYAASECAHSLEERIRCDVFLVRVCGSTGVACFGERTARAEEPTECGGTLCSFG